MDDIITQARDNLICDYRLRTDDHQQLDWCVKTLEENRDKLPNLTVDSVSRRLKGWVEWKRGEPLRRHISIPTKRVVAPTTKHPETAVELKEWCEKAEYYKDYTHNYEMEGLSWLVDNDNVLIRDRLVYHGCPSEAYQQQILCEIRHMQEEKGFKNFWSAKQFERFFRQDARGRYHARGVKAFSINEIPSGWWKLPTVPTSEFMAGILKGWLQDYAINSGNKARRKAQRSKKPASTPN